LSNSQGHEAIVNQILEGQAPEQVRAAAARGALPFPRAILVRLWVALSADSDEEIRGEAENSLAALDASALTEVLGDTECAPEVLEHFAPLATRDESLAERICFHAAASDAALDRLAAEGGADVLELVLTNQQRLLAQPNLLNILSTNPALRADQRARILEIIERMARAGERAAETGAEGAKEEEDGADFEEAARLLQVDVGELFAASEILDGEEFEMSEDPEIRSAYGRILLLNAAQKAILAMRGGREERTILIRDSNKLVSLAVLRNPRITDEDIEFFSKMRNIPTEALRTIGQHREWTKSYAIITSLVNNPRTPPGVSTNFVSRMQNQDLKKLVGNRDVPELIRRMAKRTLETRMQRVGPKMGRR
jgi:hypothetical protein